MRERLTSQARSTSRPRARRSTLSLLIDAQEARGFLSPEAVDEVARHVGATPNEVFGVAAFYPHFRFDMSDPLIEADPEDQSGPTGPTGPAGPSGRAGSTDATGAALSRAFSLGAEEVRGELASVRLAERCGAGRSVADILAGVAGTPAERRHVVCDLSSSDTDWWEARVALEAELHQVVEGLAISALAADADSAFIYACGLGEEALRRLKEATSEVVSRAGAARSVPLVIEVVVGVPAAVLSEESAVVAALEGRRPMPDPPWRPARRLELFGEPCAVLDAETLVQVAEMMRRGADQYRAATGASPGLKLYTVGGSVKRPGVVQAPLGTSLRDLIEKAGGVSGGRALKAVRTGGVNGGWLAAAYLDTPADHEHLPSAGSHLGSGSLVVADDGACAVDLARQSMTAIAAESCGRCVVCREGTMQMAEVLEDICTGRGRTGDLDLLMMLAETLAAAGPCGWGRAAAAPVLSTIRDFRAEYEAHIAERVCPADACAAASAPAEGAR